MTLREESIKVLGFYPPDMKYREIWHDSNGGTEYELTPEKARFILDHFNEKNREISSSQIDNIKESEKKHGWIDDGDILRFCEDGNIPEWQHRLIYIADNNIQGVTLEIRFGVQNNASTKTANAKARTPYDKISINDKEATKSQVSTLKKMIENRKPPKGEELSWNTADALWPKWKKYAIDGDDLVKDFFKNTSDWNSFKRIFSSWAGLLSFHDKAWIATTFLKQLEKEILDKNATTLTREWTKLATNKEVAKMSNGRRAQYFYELLCVASDRIEKTEDGRIQMGVSISDVNHNKLVLSGNYRLFLENPQNIPTTVVYKSAEIKQSVEEMNEAA